MLKVTEVELTELGLTVDPNNPKQLVSIADNEEPAESWSFERLMAYSAASIVESNRLFDEATILGRKSTVFVFRAGRALSIARTKALATNSWGAQLKAHKIGRTTAWEAIVLFKRAKTEEAIASMSITEAKQAFGMAKPKRTPAPSGEKPDPGCETKAASMRKRLGLSGAPQHEHQQEEDEEPTASEVRSYIDLASENLDRAEAGRLPVHDEAELNRIVLAAEDCETKAARILSSAKELVALEPEVVSSGLD